MTRFDDRQALPSHIQAILEQDDAARAAHNPTTAQMQRELDQRRQGWREAQGLHGGATPDKHDASLYSDPHTLSRPIGLVSAHPVMRARQEARQDATDPQTRALALALASRDDFPYPLPPRLPHTPTGGFADATALYDFDNLPRD